MAGLAGGNIRVGLEDNIWLGKGVLASNGQLVERAATIAHAMGSREIGPAEVREKPVLKTRWSHHAGTEEGCRQRPRRSRLGLGRRPAGERSPRRGLPPGARGRTAPSGGA